MTKTPPFHRIGVSASVRLAVVLGLVAALIAIAPPEPARAAPGVTLSKASVNVVEGGGTDSYTVVLDELPTDTVTVTVTADAQVQVSSGGAPAASTALTFTVGDWSVAQTVTVTAVDDGATEGPHSGSVGHATTSADTNYNIPDAGSVTANIVDNDDTFSVAFATGSSSAGEGNSGTSSATVNVQLTTSFPLTQPHTVEVARTGGSAIPGDDFSFTSPATVTFPSGAGTGALQGATVTINGDTTPESSDTVVLGLQNVSTPGTLGSPLSHTLTITNDDSDSFSVAFASASSSVTEGDSGSAAVTVTVALSTPTPLISEQTVQVARTGGTATSGADFSFTSPSTVTFPVGSTSSTTRTVTVNVNGDTEPEANETVVLVLQNVSGGGSPGSPSTHTLTINNNDFDSFSVAFASPSSSLLEGNTGTASATVNVALTTPFPLIQAQTVQVIVTGGTATSGTDFSFTSPTTVTFPAGSTSATVRPVTVTVNGDPLDEGASETVILGLQLVSSGGTIVAPTTHTLTITDDDDPPVVSVNSISVEEGLVAGFTISLSAASALPVTVSYATVNGTAVAPGDFTAIPTTPVIFAPGETTKAVPVTTIGDTVFEVTETYTLRLSGVVNGTIPVTDGVGTILDNDGAPGLSVIDPPSAAVESAGNIVFTVALLPAAGATVTATYTAANGTAVAPGDYTPTTGTVTFLAGETSKTVSVPIVNDALDEVTETLSLVLSSPTNTTIIDATAIGLIADNDNVAPVVDVHTTNAAGTPTFQFTTNQVVTAEVSFTDPGVADAHTAIVDWGDGTQSTLSVSPLGTRVFERTHAYAQEGIYVISVNVTDIDSGAGSDTSAVTIQGQGPVGGGGGDTVGLVDPTQGLWHLYNSAGALAAQFYFGNPGDYPIYGDWNCDGIETPGMYRQSDGYVYLRDTNTQGPGDIRFFFGNPGDVPIAGDFDGDGCDTVSIYRPSNQTFYIINKLGANDGGLGAADFSYVFGNPGDKPFVGDFDGNGTETVGLHRESTGLVYFRNSHTQGNADNQFIYGDPDDRLVAGDWTGDSIFSPALFRPSTTTMYFRYTNTAGVADAQWVGGLSNWLPISGQMGLG